MPEAFLYPHERSSLHERTFSIDGKVISAAVELTETQNPEIFTLPQGDICPSEQALVIASHRDHLHAGLMQWGFLQAEGR